MADLAEQMTEQPPMVEGLPSGARVEVRKRFDRSWARGFEVVNLTDSGYRLRRLSDGIELPAEFDNDDVRAERAKKDMWWY